MQNLGLLSYGDYRVDSDGHPPICEGIIVQGTSDFGPLSLRGLEPPVVLVASSKRMPIWGSGPCFGDSGIRVGLKLRFRDLRLKS